MKKTFTPIKKTAKNMVKKSARMAKSAAKQVVCDIKEIIQERLLTRNEASELFKGIVCELSSEKDRLLSFAKKELEREARKARPHVKKVLRRLRKN